MQPGTFDPRADVQYLTSRVVVDGVQRPHDSWSVGRELTGDLPDQVVSGSGITQASGTIVWSRAKDVDDRGLNPWNNASGWIPAKGARVEVFVGNGTTEWKQFHGLIDSTTGEIGGECQSTIIDDYDRLSMPMDHEPLAFRMPPANEGEWWRTIGLSARTIVNAALRYAGFYELPRHEANSELSAMLQGTSWPTYGRLLSSVPKVEGATAMGTHRASFGWAMSNFTATYEPALKSPPTRPVQITMMVDAAHAGAAILDVFWGTTNLRLWATSGRSAAVYADTGTGRVELGRLAIGAGTIVTLMVKNGAWTVKTDKGASLTGSLTLTGTTPMSEITVNLDATSRIGGIQVSHPDTSAQQFASLSHVPGASVNTSTLLGRLEASPAVVGRTAGDVLDEISKATLSAMWIDELGVFRFVGSDQLRTAAVQRTVTTLDDIFSLGWEDSLLGAASKVRVDYKAYNITLSRWTNVLLYQGSGDTAESGQENVDIMSPDTDEEWLEVDLFKVRDLPDPYGRYNRGQASMLFAYMFAADGTSYDVPSELITRSSSRIDWRTYKLTQVVGTLAAGYSVVFGTHADDTRLPPRFRGVDTPMLRGRGKFKMTDAFTETATLGPAAAPVLLHDAGPWVKQPGNTDVIENIRDFISTQTKAPQPTITGLEVTYDPRTQLGDVIRIDSPKLMGITMTALVVGVDNSSGGGFTQSLSVRIISVTTAFKTYAQYNAELGQSALTYQQWQALGPTPQTYTAFNAAPTEGATA